MPVADLQARALRGMPSQLSGTNRDKHTRSSKIDRDSRIPKELAEEARRNGDWGGIALYSIRKGESCVVLASSAG